MRTVVFTLGLRSQPSLNEWRRWHWARRAKHQRAVAEEVILLCRQAGWRFGSQPMQRARVTLTYHFPTDARRDPGNYGGKFILDALKTPRPTVRGSWTMGAGVIDDDDFKHCEEVVRLGDVAKPGYIEVEVVEREAA